MIQDYKDESPDGDRAVVNEAAGAASPSGLPSLSQAELTAYLRQYDDACDSLLCCLGIDDEADAMDTAALLGIQVHTELWLTLS